MTTSFARLACVVLCSSVAAFGCGKRSSSTPSVDGAIPKLDSAMPSLDGAAPVADSAKNEAGAEPDLATLAGDASANDLVSWLPDLGGGTMADMARDGTNTGLDSDTAASCTTLPNRWQTFVEQHRSCATSADCTLVGGVGTCNCAPFLGINFGSGDAISASALDKIQVLLDEFSSPACASFRRSHTICDAGPAGNLRCEKGICLADSRSCLFSPPDAAVDRAPTDVLEDTGPTGDAANDLTFP